MRKFSEVLEEYLTERDRQNSDYYDNKSIDARHQGRWRLEDLAKELDEIVTKQKDNVAWMISQKSWAK